MSKAFTKEAEEADEVLPEATVPDLPPGAKNYITAAGARRLREELERTQRERAVTKSTEGPDSQRQVRELERRIRSLSRRLQSVEVVDPVPGSQRVVFGATVTLRDEQDRVRRYHIVGIDEADPKRGEVSWLSPIAQALLNAKLGDVVTLKTPLGAEELEIVGLSPDRAAVDSP